jgi:hypothetical protein
MTSLIAIPFLIGSVPLGLAVVGANHFLKDKRKTNKFLYWGGITASAFIGWSVSNMLMKRYVVSEVLGAEPVPTPPKRYFYRWIGGSSGNPIFFGYPDASKFYYHNTIVHYVHPIYDEEYVKTLVHNLNKISNK